MVRGSPPSGEDLQVRLRLAWRLGDLPRILGQVLPPPGGGALGHDGSPFASLALGNHPQDSRAGTAAFGSGALRTVGSSREQLNRGN